MGTTHFSGLNIKLSAIADVAAGGISLPGIRPEDTLLAVMGVILSLSEGTPNGIVFTTIDLTSEFVIVSDDEVDNTGGTSLADTFAFVLWLDLDAS